MSFTSFTYKAGIKQGFITPHNDLYAILLVLCRQCKNPKSKIYLVLYLPSSVHSSSFLKQLFNALPFSCSFFILINMISLYSSKCSSVRSIQHPQRMTTPSNISKCTSEKRSYSSKCATRASSLETVESANLRPSSWFEHRDIPIIIIIQLYFS